MSRTVYDPRAAKLIEADPELHRLFLAAAEVVEHQSATDVASHIELGRIGLAIHRKKAYMNSPRHTYGDGAMKVVRLALGLPRGVLEFATRIAGSFTDEQLDEIANSKGVNSTKLSLQELEAVLRVPSSPKRGELVQFIYTHCPTPRQLTRKMNQLIGECRR
jgi:hypothetical protein